MVSILKIHTSQIDNNNNKNSTPIRPHSQTREAQNQDSNLLNTFLAMMGKNNMAAISFGSGIEYARPGWKNQLVGVPQDGTWIPDSLKEKIHFEATNHIRANQPWPEINNINAWMISAETQNFMSVGGLAQVAVDLPDSFNKKFKDMPGNKMTIVTPMYLNENSAKGNRLTYENGKLHYQYKDKDITVEKTATIKVPIFDEWKNGGEVTTLNVNIYEGVMNDTDTKYIFFDQSNIFNIDPIQKGGTSNAYTTNKYGYSETIRFPFFSRCVYEYIKQLNTNPENFNDTAPNVVLMNDWHTGSMGPMMKYLSQCEEDHKEIDSRTAEYFRNTPTLFIAHNLAYQGDVWDNAENPSARAKVLGTIFGKYAKNIIENSRSSDALPEEKKNAIFNADCNVNQGMMGLCLADRVIPVSVNFGEELLKSAPMANGMIELLRERHEYGTLTPITNGYTKDKVNPSSTNVVKLQLDAKNEELSDIDLSTFKLYPFNPTNIETEKPKNKEQIFNVINKILERERSINEGNDGSLANIPTSRKYTVFQPNRTDLSDISKSDLKNIPVMTFVGRVVEQKGMHNIFKNAYLQFAREYTLDQQKPVKEQKYRGWEIPVIVAGGNFNDADKPIYQQLESLKNELREINPKFADRFVLFKGFCNTNLLAMGSDFFLIPSNFEPCGLVQMEVMAKGVIPIAAATGGLVSTIDQFKSGFLSSVHYDNSNTRLYKEEHTHRAPDSNAMGYKDAIENALFTYFKKPNQLAKMQKTAMLKDFSWAKDDGALDKYVSLMKTGQLTSLDRPYQERPDASNREPYAVPDMETIIPNKTLNPNMEYTSDGFKVKFDPEIRTYKY